MSSPSIAVVIPWFGPWEPWAPLFFETARRNPGLDFLVFSDRVPPVQAANVRVTTLTFADYTRRASERLGFSFDPPDAYKLCDLRPMYGQVHEEDFRGYDFYGWCDVDLLFGDVRSFYTDEVLARWDVLSTHAHRVSGHFALFRNTERNRGMYRRIYRWREALADPDFVGIDEHGITNAYLMTVFDRANEKFGWSLDNTVTRAASRLRKRRILMEERYTTPFLPRPWLDGTLDSDQPETWYYRDGRVTNARDGDRSFLYIHLMNFKSSRWRHDGTPAPWEGLDAEEVCTARPEDMTRGIVIDPSGIHPLEEGMELEPEPDDAGRDGAP